jgi:hypothetical protein
MVGLHSSRRDIAVAAKTIAEVLRGVRPQEVSIPHE